MTTYDPRREPTTPPPESARREDDPDHAAGPAGGAHDGIGNQAAHGLLRPRDEGVPLPTEVRARMQARLGQDLGGVRMHAGAEARRRAGEIDAVAFTTGEDIVLGAKADAPGTEAGDRLLAHELTHVVQQRQAAHVVDGVGGPGDSAETAAHAVAHGAGAATTATGGAVHAVQRQPVLGKERMPVKREEVEKVLADYLEQVLQQQGRRTIDKTPQVINAITSLFRDDPVQASVELWLKGITDGTPAGLALEVARKLPAVIPEDRLDKIRGTPKKPSQDKSPKTAGEAMGAGLVDTTVAPLLRKLPLSKDKQDKIIDAARSAVGDGVVGILDAVLDASGIGGPDKGAIHSAVEAAIKQQPGKAMDRQQDGAGSPYRKELSPSVAPAPPKAPGEKIFKLPAIPWDFPGTKAPPKPPAPPRKIDAAVEQAALKVDPNALIPAEVRGTDRAEEFGATGVDFALDVAKRLDAAQAKKDAHLYLEMGAQYANIKDRSGVFAAAKAIVFVMRDALTHHAALVERVTFTVGGEVAFSFSLHPSPE